LVPDAEPWFLKRNVLIHERLRRRSGETARARKKPRVLRTMSVSTKVTEDEYAVLAALAGDQSISEWARDTLLRAATPDHSASVVVGELLALRTILLNLHFAVCRGEPVTQETMQRFIDRADLDKVQKAHELLVSSSRGMR
jgi:hypothetical protein